MGLGEDGVSRRTLNCGLATFSCNRHDAPSKMRGVIGRHMRWLASHNSRSPNYWEVGMTLWKTYLSCQDPKGWMVFHNKSGSYRVLSRSLLYHFHRAPAVPNVTVPRPRLNLPSPTVPSSCAPTGNFSPRPVERIPPKWWLVIGRDFFLGPPKNPLRNSGFRNYSSQIWPRLFEKVVKEAGDENTRFVFFVYPFRLGCWGCWCHVLDVGDVINVFVLTNKIHGMIARNTSMRRWRTDIYIYPNLLNPRNFSGSNANPRFTRDLGENPGFFQQIVGL